MLYDRVVPIPSSHPLWRCCHLFHCPSASITQFIVAIISLIKEVVKQQRLYLHFFLPWYSSFFRKIWVSNLYYFPSLWRTSFNISCKARSTDHTFLQFFVCLRKDFISSLLNDNFARYNILGWRLFSFNTWIFPSTPFLLVWFLMRKSKVPLPVRCAPRPQRLFFSRFALSLVSCSSNTICSGVDFFGIYPAWYFLSFRDL